MKSPGRNWLEWLVFALSLAIISGVLGVLLNAVLGTDGSPPRIEVFLGDSREENGLYVVPVLVRNVGEKPAAEVRIEAVLSAGSTVERAGFDLSYSPGGSVRQGEITFSIDPRGGRVKARALGFESP